MTKEFFLEQINQRIIIMDGATGTELVKSGLPTGVCPEKWILENPRAIQNLQKKYEEAGSDIVFAPTFGCNYIKLAEFGLQEQVREMNRRLVQISREGVNNAWVFGDMTTTGKFVEPNGEEKFEHIIEVYKEQAISLAEAGVDGFVIETMIDLQETRAALIAIKETTNLPVIVSLTFNEDQLTLTGNNPLSSLLSLQALGADAFGCNCSTGPEKMLDIVKAIKPYSRVPILAKPNAGMPKLRDGKTYFDMSPDIFSQYCEKMILHGVNIIGGCCGTTPEHIKALKETASRHVPVPAGPKKEYSAVCSATKTHFFTLQPPFTIIGERINPTGKKALQEELRSGGFNLVKQMAKEQTRQKANILDVNMGLSGIDETEMLEKAVYHISQSSSLPLCIDSTSPEAVEKALRFYPGRALLNSISGEKKRLEKILPVAAKYGAMFILLPLTDEGIPQDLEIRIKVINEIMEEAAKYGYKKEDIVVDGLVMTIASDSQAALLTLKQMEYCAKELKINTTCGLSNVSFGAPKRKWINGGFLAMALSAGLTSAILNPSSSLLQTIINNHNQHHRKIF